MESTTATPWFFIPKTLLKMYNIFTSDLREEDSIIEEDRSGVWIKSKSKTAVTLALKGLDIAHRSALMRSQFGIDDYRPR